MDSWNNTVLTFSVCCHIVAICGTTLALQSIIPGRLLNSAKVNITSFLGANHTSFMVWVMCSLYTSCQSHPQAKIQAPPGLEGITITSRSSHTKGHRLRLRQVGLIELLGERFPAQGEALFITSAYSVSLGLSGWASRVDEVNEGLTKTIAGLPQSNHKQLSWLALTCTLEAVENYGSFTSG